MGEAEGDLATTTNGDQPQVGRQGTTFTREVREDAGRMGAWVASEAVLELHMDGGKGNGKLVRARSPRAGSRGAQTSSLTVCFQLGWNAAGNRSRLGLGGHVHPGPCSQLPYGRHSTVLSCQLLSQTWGRVGSL